MPDTTTLPEVAPHDACIACFRGDTDTCFGLEGSLEAHVAFDIHLGIPEDQALASAIYGYKRHEVEDLDDRLTAIYLVCRECATIAKLPNLSSAAIGSVVTVNSLPSDRPDQDGDLDG